MPVGARDFYDVLGVGRKASDDEIRKAYRNLAKRWHPDKHQGADKAKAEAKFKEINEAYDVLGDPEKRSKYDRFGPLFQNMGPGATGQGEPGGPFAGFAGFRPGGSRGGPFQTSEGGEGFNKILEDLFEELFRRGGGGSERAPAGRPAQPPSEGEVELSLEDANRGGRKRLTLTQASPCPVCGGDRLIRGQLCHTCGGLGFRTTERQLDVKIPPGVRDGTKLRVSGSEGDLSLGIKIGKHPVFVLEGDDLRLDLPVLPHEAALGAEVEVPTLEGKVRVTIPPGTSSGKTLRLRGKGMARRDGSHGDLLARIMLVLDGPLNETQRRSYRDLAAATDVDPREDLFRKARQAAP
ncbi:MAG: DnaJ domain-containing protein [Cyanobacteria bacterium REEB65]|nr:DnaJ domain-containing protein [Cyanobacteria bacterium REEB65]